MGPARVHDLDMPSNTLIALFVSKALMLILITMM
jgi:hypothetical protein